jgi:hypothetical protein
MTNHRGPIQVWRLARWFRRIRHTRVGPGIRREKLPTIDSLVSTLLAPVRQKRQVVPPSAESALGARERSTAG